MRRVTVRSLAMFALPSLLTRTSPGWPSSIMMSVRAFGFTARHRVEHALADLRLRDVIRRRNRVRAGRKPCGAHAAMIVEPAAGYRHGGSS